MIYKYDDYIPPPLHSAVKGKNYEVVKLLLELGANPNYIFMSNDEEVICPLILAIDNNDLDMVKLLIKYKGDYLFYFSFIISPCEKDYFDIVECLILDIIGKKYDKKLKFLTSGLCAAATNGNIDIINLYFNYFLKPFISASNKDQQNF